MNLGIGLKSRDYETHVNMEQRQQSAALTWSWDNQKKCINLFYNFIEVKLKYNELDIFKGHNFISFDKRTDP